MDAAGVHLPYPAKVIGNGLRELDRFLSVFLDEFAAAGGWTSEDLVSLARIRNTPNKLEAICFRMNTETGHDTRLRALGRCRDALFHCGGLIQRGDHRHSRIFTLGWPGDAAGGAPKVLDLGERFSVSAADLAWICAFYVSIADDIVRSA